MTLKNDRLLWPYKMTDYYDLIKWQIIDLVKIIYD